MMILVIIIIIIIIIIMIEICDNSDNCLMELKNDNGIAYLLSQSSHY